MTSIDDLLSEYIREHRASGDADPVLYLHRATAGERGALAALIDGFLATAKRDSFDPAAFAAFRSDPKRQAFVSRVVAGETLLDVRRASSLKKSAVAGLLADRFGFAGRAQTVKACYHEIETGQVNPTRVRDCVWDALADIFGRAEAQLRDAAQLAFERRLPTAGAFTRSDEAALAVRPASPAGPARADPVREAFFID